MPWSRPVANECLQALPFKASLATFLTPGSASQIVRFLANTAKEQHLCSPFSHVDVTLEAPNLPPHDYVYLTSDVDFADASTFLAPGTPAPVVEGPVDGVRCTTSWVLCAGVTYRLELLATMGSSVGIAHLFPSSGPTAVSPLYGGAAAVPSASAAAAAAAAAAATTRSGSAARSSMALEH
eukprot:Rhum_TRINITY_DN12265_c0_g1::Rhum_TRINITY_DN12265_c0_g1_i2::g.50317::m.50317